MKKVRFMAFAILVMAIAAFILGGSSQASAVDSGKYLPIVTKLAAAFNLNADDVQKIFEADRQEKEVACQTMTEQRLSEALSNGTISQQQYDTIMAAIAKMKEADKALMNVQKELAAQSKDLDLRKMLGPCGHGPGGGPPMPPPM